MLEGRVSIHHNDNWMAVHRKCIHIWNSEIVFPTIRNFKLLLFHWRKDASITKTSGDAFFEWFTRCGEAPHGSIREFLGVRYFCPLESKSSVKIAVPSADVNGSWASAAKRESESHSQTCIILCASKLWQSFSPWHGQWPKHYTKYHI